MIPKNKSDRHWYINHMFYLMRRTNKGSCSKKNRYIMEHLICEYRYAEFKILNIRDIIQYYAKLKNK